MTPTAEPQVVTSKTPSRTKLLSRRLLVDLVIAAILLVGSGVWATRFWNDWVAQGGQPIFYQLNFEPAVMVACGKGFVVIESARPQALDDFLRLRRDKIDCADLPQDARFGRKGLFQGALRYLLTTVGWAWRLLGISWSGMAPLFGLLFGVVIALAYGIFRLGMGRVGASACAFAVAISYSHLTNLPHLRDYAKAPFTLALVLILGIVVTQPVRRGVLLSLAVSYGAVLGVGYGFRTDFLVNLPVFVFVVFAFLDGGVLRNLMLKAAAAIVFLATFLVVSWPVTSAVYQEGGCQWHVALLGLQSPFDPSLHVAPAPYDFGYAYSDDYIAQTIDGYANRMTPGSEKLPFCSHEYDVQSGRYLLTTITTFPADLISRAYASVLQVAELPFVSWSSPLKGWATELYEIRKDFLQPKIGWGLYFVGAAVLMASARSVRLAGFLLFFLAYFGGYPAIQFHERHHFHLEFMSWWAIGFVVHQSMAGVWSFRHGNFPSRNAALGAARTLAFAAAAVAMVVGPLLAARWYQRREASRLFDSYIAAPKVPLAPSGGVLEDIPPRGWPLLLEVDLDRAQCGRNPVVTFRYEPDMPGGDLSRAIAITSRSSQPGVTRIFQPVFRHYRGLEFSDAGPGCVLGAFRLAHQQGFPLLFSAVLPPGWSSTPLYQRVADLEPDPTLPDLVPMPDVTQWAVPEGRTVSTSLFGTLHVVGDQSTSGYQLSSPRVDAPVGSRVRVRTNLAAQHGQVCVGALNGTAAAWLSPASGVRQDMIFIVDQTGGFIVTVANCNPTEIRMPTRFSLSQASYAID